MQYAGQFVLWPFNPDEQSLNNNIRKTTLQIFRISLTLTITFNEDMHYDQSINHLQLLFCTA